MAAKPNTWRLRTWIRPCTSVTNQRKWKCQSKCQKLAPIKENTWCSNQLKSKTTIWRTPCAVMEMGFHRERFDFNLNLIQNGVFSLIWIFQNGFVAIPSYLITTDLLCHLLDPALRAFLKSIQKREIYGPTWLDLLPLFASQCTCICVQSLPLLHSPTTGRRSLCSVLSLLVGFYA